MSRLKLLSLGIENFKGIKDFSVEPKGKNAEIIAENGVGKTTVYDAFDWLLFDKDSTGRKDFKVRPLDEYNEPVRNIIVRVTAGIEVDGISHFFRKEQHEKVVKKRDQVTGYETLCWIDEAPKKVGEYQKYIEEIIPEKHFRLLTDLRYFNEKLHWKERREMLLEVAGEIGAPAGFDELLQDSSKYKDLDDYKDMLKSQKKRHTKERDECKTRVDETFKRLEQPGDINVEELTEKREELEGQKKGCQNILKEVLAEGQARQSKIDQMNELKRQQIEREAELRKPDPEKTKQLVRDKANLRAEITEAEDSILLKEKELVRLKGEIINAEIRQKANRNNLKIIRNEKTKIESAEDITVCYACGQDLPKNKLDEMQKDKNTKLAEIDVSANRLKVTIEKTQEEIEGLKKSVSEIEEVIKKLIKARDELKAENEEKIKAINLNLGVVPDIDPGTDDVWIKICYDIENLQAELGEPVSERMKAVNAQLEQIEKDLQEVNTKLSKSDRLKQDKERIKELEKQEKDLSQAIAEIDEKIDQVQRFKAEQSKLVTAKVNGMFESVEFKMFDIKLNGSIEDCCDTLLNGVPDSDMSFGQKIYTGLDIVNTFSRHYGSSCPLFIDHIESMTYPIQSKSQLITLRAKDSYVEKVINKNTGEITEVYHDYSKLTVETIQTEKEKAVA